MSRKQWIVVASIIIFILVIGIVLIQWNDNSSTAVESARNLPVPDLGYCSDEQVKPCVVSFGVDAFDNMLINILVPDLSFPNFYMKIAHSAGETVYACQRLSTAINTAYCAGKKLPPGEVLHLMLFSMRDDSLLAEGKMPIIGLAYPTVGIAVSTPQGTPTASTPAVSPTPTLGSIFVLPDASETPTPSPEPSYPNPSYPNPSYP